MQRSISKLIGGAALAGAVAMASPLYAATQGTLGGTSQGTSDISLNIGDVVRISGLDDINLGLYPGVGNMQGTERFCVYRNATGLYDLNLSTARNFRVGDGTNSILYVAGLGDDAGSTATSHTNVTNPTFAGVGDTTATDCAGATNATLTVDFTEVDLQAAPNGTYSDTITLTVSPR